MSQPLRIPLCLYGNPQRTRQAWSDVIRAGLGGEEWCRLFGNLPTTDPGPNSRVLIRDHSMGLCERRASLWRLHWVVTCWEWRQRTFYERLEEYLEYVGAGVAHPWFAIPLYMHRNTISLPQPTLPHIVGHYPVQCRRLLDGLFRHLDTYAAHLGRFSVGHQAVGPVPLTEYSSSPHARAAPWYFFLCLLAAFTNTSPEELFSLAGPSSCGNLPDALIEANLITRTSAGYGLVT